MALIKCPECGKEISDKAPSCIFCGYPLQQVDENKAPHCFALVAEKIETKSLICGIIENDFQIPFNKLWVQIKILPTVIASGLTLENAQFIADRYSKLSRGLFTYKESNESLNPQYNQIIDKQREKANAPVSCPRCGSTQITTGARGVSWTRGLIGASKTVNRCAKCGYQWAP